MEPATTPAQAAVWGLGMQFLLLAFFVLLAIALGSVLGLALPSLPPIELTAPGAGGALDAVFSLFTQPKVAISLTLGILMAAFFAAVIYATESWLRRRPIRKLTRQLVKTSPNAVTFAANIDSVADLIQSSHAPLKHAWEEFEETLIRPDPFGAAETAVVRNTLRPSAYFNVQATIDAGFHLPFWQALPNYFVGFGLLCTFFGLVSGLHFAAEGVASSDVNLARHALQDLLRAATFKFLTSIAGVLASLGLSVFVRSQTQALQSALDQFCSALEKRLIFVTPEFVAMEQLREQQKLTVTMQSFNTDFAAQVADALDRRMTNAEGKNVFVAAIENLGQTFKGNAGDIGSNVSEAVLTGLSAPLQTLTGAMTLLTDASSGAVDRMNEFSNTYSVKITQATQSFEGSIVGAR